ncbi:hypothetical protein [Pediococcus acidilactici]|nr:hypothetical protein [Pediococcus acidilactici]
MKKIITVMAALTMAVTLGACGKKAASSGTVSSEKNDPVANQAASGY